MDIYKWTMKPTGGAITVDGFDIDGEPVKARNIKLITPHYHIYTKQKRWWQKKPRRIVTAVWLNATDKDGKTHKLHIIR